MVVLSQGMRGPSAGVGPEIDKIYGKNPSPNLLNLNNGTIVKKGSSGYWSYTNNANSITMTATGTTGAQYAEWTTDQLDASKTYTFSGIAKKIVKGTGGDPNLKIYHMYSDNGTTWSSYSEIWKRSASNVVQGTAYSFSFQESGHKYYRFYFYNNSNTPVTVGESTTYYDLQIEEGTKKTAFQPYMGIQGARSMLKVYGKNPSKNLFDNSSAIAYRGGNVGARKTKTGITVYNTSANIGGSDFVVYDIGAASDYAGKTVHFSAQALAGGPIETGNVPQIGIGLASTDYSSRSSKQQANGIGFRSVSWTVTTDSSRPRLVIWLYLNQSSSISTPAANTASVDYTNIMISVGDTAESYTPYGGPQGTAQIFPSLAKPPLGKVIYYTDSDKTITNTAIIRTQSELDQMCANWMSWTALIGNALVTNENVKEVTLYSGVDTLSSLFLGSCTNIDKVDLSGTSITAIPNSFMSGCQSFNGILKIPSGITKIEGFFLSNCQSFNQPITIPSPVVYIGEHFMSGCSAFNKSIAIPNNVISIGSSFFLQNKAFNAPITLSNKLRTIGESFMGYCESFNRSFSLPSTITSIGEGLLHSATNMTGTINVGSIPATVIPTDSSTGILANTTLGFWSIYGDKPMYQTGVKIAGANRAAWRSRLPNLDDVNGTYRKLLDAGS